jgi:hypothetical protein
MTKQVDGDAQRGTRNRPLHHARGERPQSRPHIRVFMQQSKDRFGVLGEHAKIEVMTTGAT